MRFDRWGNRLYTGQKSYDIVGRRRTWYVVSAVILLLSVGALLLRGGLNLGIDFTGGAQFTVSGAPAGPDESLAEEAVVSVLGPSEVQAAIIGEDSVRIRTGELSTQQSGDISESLAEAYEVEPEEITTQFIGPSWGQEISRGAIQGLVVFLVLVSAVIAVYFRTWKMAVAALAGLVFNMVFTVGTYAAAGLEVTPSTVVGFLTILGYSLYDTVVVFDKVRENTEEAMEGNDRSFAEAANLAVNQTLVRSINTSVVALLPIVSILLVALLLLGAGSLLDLSLVLFVGIAVGTFSSIFVATPLLVHLRAREPKILAQAEKVARRRTSRPVPAASLLVDDDRDDELASIDRLSLQKKDPGQREQPRRAPRSRR